MAADKSSLSREYHQKAEQGCYWNKGILSGWRIYTLSYVNVWIKAEGVGLVT